MIMFKQPLMTKQGYIKTNLVNHLRRVAIKDKKQFKNTKAWAQARFISHGTAFKLIHGSMLSWDSVFSLMELLRVDMAMHIHNVDSWEKLNDSAIDIEETF